MEEGRQVKKSHREHRSSKPHHTGYKQHRSRGEKDRIQPQRNKSKEHETHHSRDLLPTAPALKGDDSYVRRWLANAETETTQHHVDHYRKLEPKRTSDHRIRGNEHPDRPTYIVENEPEQERKRKYELSLDSSLIDSPPRWRSRELDYEEPSPPVRPPKHRYKSQKISPPEPEPQQSSYPPSSPLKEVFHKRARHKTREDRYESKTVRKAHYKDDEPERKRPKRATKNGQKKVANKSGGELMHNFKSDKISKERLTMRPSNGPGLFKNGRASSPVRRRGVPDLAFSEMDFLQHANRHQVGSAEVGEMSRFREKERRKASKVQNNFTAFFQANRIPHKEVGRNRPCSSSAHANESDSYQRRRQERGDENIDRKNNYQSQPLYSDRPYLDFGQPGPSSEKASGRAPANLPNHRSSPSLPPERATSYISWSETQHSPHRTAMRNRLANVEEARETHSPTPESIRRIIEETGIFRDTGIKTSSHHGHLETRKSSRKEELRDQKRILIPRSQPEPCTSSTNSHAGSRKHGRNESETNIRPADKQQRPDKPELMPKGAQALGRTQGPQEYPQQVEETSRKGHSKNIIVEHFDGKQEWRQQTSPAKRVSQTPVSAVRSKLRRTTSTPLSREQIAEQARIRRPLTSLSRLSNASILQPILETEFEAEQGKHSPAEMHPNSVPNIGSHRSHRSKSLSHTNHEKPLEHKHIPAVQNRAISSIASVLTPNSISRNSGGIIHPRSAQTTPFTQATSNPQYIQSGSSLNSNNATSQYPHYLGLPIRGGSAVNSNVYPSIAAPPIYTSQAVQQNMYGRSEEYTELAHDGLFGNHYECGENEFSAYPEDAQYEKDGEYQGPVDTRDGNSMRDFYEAPHFEAQTSWEAHGWQPNAENNDHDELNHIYDQDNGDDAINHSYVGYGMQFEEVNHLESSMLEQQEDQMSGFWRPQWEY